MVSAIGTLTGLRKYALLFMIKAQWKDICELEVFRMLWRLVSDF